MDRPAAPACASAGDRQSRATPTFSEMMAARTASLREHLAALAAAAPRLPSEFRSAADRLLAELQGRRLVGVLILVLGFIALGSGTEWVFRKVTAQPQQRIFALPMETVPERLRAIGLRLAFGLSEVAIFGLGCIGAFLAFDWPPLLRQVVLAYLVAAVFLRLTLVLGRFLLAPDIGRPRKPSASASSRCPPTPPGSGFAAWRSSSGGSPSVGPRSMSSATLGFSPEARELVAYALGLGLLAIALNVVWARPAASSQLPDGRTARRVTRSRPGSYPSSWCCSGGFGSRASCACSGLRRSRSSCRGRSCRPAGEPPCLARPRTAPRPPPRRALMAVYLDRGIRAAADRRRRPSARARMGDRSC